ncbi:MAG: hypothetical protein NTV70_11455 [Acidobacteria bacterium]|nr:hypothetical protein [Acidobacteriota bacterium]
MQLLSLKKNIDDLDRMDRERRDIYAAIGETIRVVGETAIRFDDEQTNRHKGRLQRLAEQLETSPKELLGGVQREFKLHQTSYQGEAEEYIYALRANLTSTARLLQEMMSNVDVRGSHHQADLGQEIDNLRALQQIEDLAQLKLELGTVASRMSQSLEELKREHQMMVAQMRDELQALHRELANRKMPSPPPAPKPAAPSAQTPPPSPARPPQPASPVAPAAESQRPVAPATLCPASSADTAPQAGVGIVEQPAVTDTVASPVPKPAEPAIPASQRPTIDYGMEPTAAELTALNSAVAPEPPPPPPAEPEQFGMRRRDLENMIRMKVESTDTFCLMIVWLRNLPALFNKHQPDVVLETMNAAARRLGKTLVGNPLWSKWEDDSFVVFVGQPKANAQKASKEIADKLNAVYSIESPNGPVEVALRVAAGVVDRTKDENADHLLGRAQQLIKNLRAMP